MTSNAGNTVAELHETSMATRAAWMHFAGGMTQSEVAQRLGITALKAHRLIARASRDGLIRVFVDGAIAECVQLEIKLSERYHLGFCQVAPILDDEPLPLKPLGMSGAQFLKLAIERGEDTLIGVGHGRTLAASVDYLPRMQAGQTRFVSLLGGLTRKFSANPHDVIHRLADRTGAEAFVMPVPFIANTVDDLAVLMAQQGISEIFDLAKQANLLFVGIGTVEPQASLVATGMIRLSEIDEVKAAGGAGEMLGHFFDAEGRLIDTELSKRTLSLSVDELKGRKIVALAGGVAKVDAIRAVLRSGLIHGLITDEKTAIGLAD